MKYGLITFKNTENIGDDIQSYAAIQFLPQIDYYVEREALNEFVPQENEMVTTIMNGWYMHDICSMPPSPFLNTLMTSIHFTNHLEDKCPEYLDGLFIEYLKQKQPIGCRDNLVRKYLSEKGVDNFFSGCLTLTIDKFENIEKQDYICAVDLDEESIEKIKKETKREVVEVTHYLNSDKNSKLTYEQRMENVKKLLKKYQAAKCVITNRLHCVLPCLALETPVLFIYNGKNVDIKNRLGDYLGMLNYMDKEEFLGEAGNQYLQTIPENKREYLQYRNSLKKQVKEFINTSKELNLKPEIDKDLYSKYFVEQKKYLIANCNAKTRKIQELKEKSENYNLELKDVIKNNENEIKKYKLQLDASEKENFYMKKNMKKKITQLNKIKKSKMYKISNKMRKLKKKIVFWRKK